MVKESEATRFGPDGAEQMDPDHSVLPPDGSIYHQDSRSDIPVSFHPYLCEPNTVSERYLSFQDEFLLSWEVGC